MSTVNKDLEQPAHGSEVNTWDEPLNDNFGKLDLAFGGSTTLNAAGGSGNVDLTVTQVTPPTLIVSGLPVGNVTYRIPATVGGTWIVSNNTTGGFDIGFVSLSGGSTVVIPPGINTLISCDGTSRGVVQSSQTDPADRALVFIETLTANDTSDVLEWTGLSGYDNYLLLIERLLPASGSPLCRLQFGQGGSPTWITSGYYALETGTTAVGATVASLNSYQQNTAGIRIVGTVENNSLLGFNARVNFNNFLAGGSKYPAALLQAISPNTSGSDPTAALINVSAGAFLTSTTANTALRIITSTGVNWLSGKATLFAYRLEN